MSSQDLSQRGKLTWYGDSDFSTFMRRAFAKGTGLTDADFSTRSSAWPTSGAN